ncbi:MAG: JAB domain-containing protein, partial [Candidatus Omnitrophica bacterium]|nr:JAB domain-containing protein [Candidatus Omnitrophota bacterium]
VGFTKGGKVYIVQGNGRTGAVLGMEGAGKEKYFGMMLQKAQELGIPTDKVTDDMMLVRTLSPVHTYEDARKLGAFGQKSSALPMTEVEEARSFQNAQRLKFGLNLNLTGIGRRSINEKNVGTFIRNNPQVYQKILKLSGYDPIAVQYRPAEQAKVVNTALLAQLDKDFIRTVSKKGEDTHELVKVTAPIIADNQKDIAEGSVPPNGDIQKFLKNAIDHYATLNSAVKNSLKVDKNGNIPFLETGEQGRKNPDSLISRMRQETIEFGDKKSGNIFRNPVNVIGMIAYHQAMTPRDPEKKDQARELFALKMKRFADAMKTLKEKAQQGGDIFAAQLSEEEQTRQQQEDIIKIAERVFLENKPYREENPEEMTAEEKEAGKETYNAFNVYKRMRDVSQEFQFELEHHKLKKSLLGYFFKSIIQKQHNELKQFKTDQMSLFGAPEEKHNIGDTKIENGIKYTLLETTIGKPRWHTEAELERPSKKVESQPTSGIPFKKLKPKTKQESSQVHGNMVEYATQELFKQKGKKSADKVFKAVADKFNGKENMFLGGKVSITAEQLKDAVYNDKIKTFNNRYKDAPDKIEAAIEPFVSYFNLDEKELRKRLQPDKPIRTEAYRKRQTEIDNMKRGVEITKEYIEELTDAVENPAWEASRKEYPEKADEDIKKLNAAKKDLAKQEKELAEIEKVHARETEIENRQEPLFAEKQKAEAQTKNKKLSGELLSEFKDGKYSGVEFKALGIAKDIKEYKCSMIIGKKLDAKNNSEKLKQLAALSQIYRDPRFETFRIIYTKGDKIVGHTGITLRLPGSTLIVPPNIKGKDVYKHYQIEMENLKADGMYFVHNHPSGHVTPSIHDITATKEIAKNLGDKFKGHVVIDSNIYSTIDKDGYVDEELAIPTEEEKEDVLTTPSIPHDILGEKIFDPAGIATIMRKHKLDIEDGKSKIVIASDAYNKIRGIIAVDKYLLLDKEKAKDILRRISVQSGCQSLFIAGIEDQYNKEEDFTSSNANIRDLYKENFILDVVSKRGNSLMMGTGIMRNPDSDPFGVKEESRQLVKSIFRFFKSQMDMFGAPKQPTQPKPEGGISWKALGQEKPGHKYIRRERGKTGEWVYYYKDAQGREFKGDAKGKELPKHHDWNKGDVVIHDGRKYELGKFGDTMATIVSQKGEVKAVRIAELTHEAEHQKKLVTEHETKWDRLVSALEADVAQFDKTGKSINFPEDKKFELQRKLKYAKEERDKRQGKQSQTELEPLKDEKGEPIVLYHGTKQEFDKFDPERIGSASDYGFYGKGFYFSPNKATASGYGHIVKESHVSFKKPLIYDDDAPDYFKIKAKYFDKGGNDLQYAEKVREHLEKDGFDGVVLKHAGKIEQVVAFNPEQIKDIDKQNSPNVASDDVIPSEPGLVPATKPGSSSKKVTQEDLKASKVSDSNYKKYLRIDPASGKISKIDYIVAKQLQAYHERGDVLGIDAPAEWYDSAASKKVDQTETPEFKKWFGDSKVVDKEGKPKVVYHASTENFKEFDTSAEGAHFGTEEQALNLKKAGKKKPKAFYLSINNPLRMDDVGIWNDFNGIHARLANEDKITAKEADEIWDEWQKTDEKGWSKLKEVLKRKGYDGFVYANEQEGEGDSYVAFSPEQIKSIENKGTFDPNTGDITKSVSTFFKQLTKARKETDTEPTEAEKRAGNYAKGKLELYGLT